MKKTAIFLALTMIVLSSCTKKKVTPTTGTTVARTIAVEYRITSTSADVNVEYIAPNTTGVLIMTTAHITRPTETISFTSTSRNTFTINAKNANMSTQDITVEIFVDGALFKSGSLNHKTLTASASGLVQ